MRGLAAAVLVTGSGGVGQSRVLGSCSPGAAAAHAGLAAVAIHAVVLIWKLVRIDILTKRGRSLI